jgi:hypothetical protein
MHYFISLAIGILLFVGFLAVVMYETRRGKRFFEPLRRRLDRQVRLGIFVLTYVDWKGFFRHLFQSLFARMAHDVAHMFLVVVRVVERQLTSVVRYLRDRRPNVLAPKPSREPIVAQTIRYVRKTLRLPDSGRK